jgi:hypothetical protein
MSMGATEAVAIVLPSTTWEKIQAAVLEAALRLHQEGEQEMAGELLEAVPALTEACESGLAGFLEHEVRSTLEASPATA